MHVHLTGLQASLLAAGAGCVAVGERARMHGHGALGVGIAHLGVMASVAGVAALVAEVAVQRLDKIAAGVERVDITAVGIDAASAHQTQLLGSILSLTRRQLSEQLRNTQAPQQSPN